MTTARLADPALDPLARWGHDGCRELLRDYLEPALRERSLVPVRVLDQETQLVLFSLAAEYLRARVGEVGR